MTVVVITTGGTIGALAYDDPVHPPEYSQMPADGRDLVAEILALPDFQFIPIRCVSFKPRDSKDIDAAYLEQMLDLIGAMPESNIVITHGTDRILNTADYLYRRAEIAPILQGKQVILTGAMTPLANGSESDGFKNLRFCLQAFKKPMGFLSGQVLIVLCDYINKVWQPIVYKYKPDTFVKVYVEDGRYHRLTRITS
jgi:L-asparaginase